MASSDKGDACASLPLWITTYNHNHTTAPWSHPPWDKSIKTHSSWCYTHSPMRDLNSINFVTNSMDMDIDNDTDIDAAIDFAIGIVCLQQVSLLLLLRLLLLPRMFILTLRYTLLKWCTIFNRVVFVQVWIHRWCCSLSFLSRQCLVLLQSL